MRGTEPLRACSPPGAWNFPRSERTGTFLGGSGSHRSHFEAGFAEGFVNWVRDLTEAVEAARRNGSCSGGD